jgi:hypothetical protein
MSALEFYTQGHSLFVANEDRFRFVSWPSGINYTIAIDLFAPNKQQGKKSKETALCITHRTFFRKRGIIFQVF